MPWPGPSGPRATTAPAPMAERDRRSSAWPCGTGPAGETEPEILGTRRRLHRSRAPVTNCTWPRSPHWLAAERRALRLRPRPRHRRRLCRRSGPAPPAGARAMTSSGLDSSPLAVRTARARGVTPAWCLSADDAHGPRSGRSTPSSSSATTSASSALPNRLRRVLTVVGPPGPGRGTDPGRQHQSLRRRRSPAHPELLLPQPPARPHARTGPDADPLPERRRAPGSPGSSCRGPRCGSLLRGTGWHQSRITRRVPGRALRGRPGEGRGLRPPS